MKKPTQLIINDVRLPTTTRDRYLCYPEDLKETLVMADGSMAEEMTGIVRNITYSYDKMEDGTYRQVLAVVRGGGVKNVAFLPDDGSTELVTSRFLVTSITQPSLNFYLNGKPRWHNFGFTLREVEPHA